MYKILFAKSLFLFLALCISHAGASFKSPLPQVATSEWQGLQIIGETSLRKIGFHIYDVSFWTKTKKLNSESWKNCKANTDKLEMDKICALSITYARNIKAEKLVSSTKKEWLRLGYEKKFPINEWIIMLRNIWPDVKKSDQLVVVTTSQGKSVFYNKNERLGTIDDAEFGPAFLNIWIDENTRYKKNRLELIGRGDEEI